MWFLYELGLLLAFALYLPKALWRRRLPHPGWSMRLGHYPEALRRRLGRRPSIWLHAVSVGETMAARPLVLALAERYPDHDLVLSTVTITGFNVAQRLADSLGECASAIYFPLDLRGCVRRALEAIQPRLLILMESELWPAAIHEARSRGTPRERGVPVAIVNGRISARAFRRYHLVRPLLHGMLEEVALFLMKSEDDAQRIRALGAPPSTVRVMGSLKWDASLATRPSSDDVQTTASRLGLKAGEPVIVAGSTHRGEEAAMLTAYRSLRDGGLSSRLIIAPRHQERVEEAEALVARAGFRALRVSQAGGCGWDVAIVDSMGELPRYYGLATVVFIGGSLIPHGGQNPLEAASLGKPVVFGPFMHNFEDIAQPLIEGQAAIRLQGADELTSTLRPLLVDPAAATAMGRRGQALTERATGATQRALAELDALLMAQSTQPSTSITKT